MQENYLITGAAGFIGFHLSKKLLESGNQVIGIDNINSYYDTKLKYARLELLKQHSGFSFHQIDIADRNRLNEVFAAHPGTIVIHLAAQAGVRHSIHHPHAYVESNLVGFVNVLEACRHNRCPHLIYASSSSVYGNQDNVPFSTDDDVNKPVSLYAATKRANELMAYTYAHLYSLPSTGLRFFTVYGPWGRPDMAYFSFTKQIIEGKPIKVFNHGNLERDFTYIDDIVEGICRLINKIPDASSGLPPYHVFNIGNHQPVKLGVFIEILERLLGKKAVKEPVEMQAGDVLRTYADIEPLKEYTGFSPSTPLEKGLEKFISWFERWHK